MKLITLKCAQTCPVSIISPSLIRAETILSENPFWHHSKEIKKKSRPSSIDKDLQGSFFSEKQMTVATQCLKIIKKVSYNIAKEASYVYIVNGQK